MRFRRTQFLSKATGVLMEASISEADTCSTQVTRIRSHVMNGLPNKPFGGQIATPASFA